MTLPTTKAVVLAALVLFKDPLMFTESVIEYSSAEEYQGEFAQTILNTNPNVDWKTQPMFFGEHMGLQRSDQIRYKVFHRLTEEQLSNYWRPHDVNLRQDKEDFDKLAPNLKHLFVNNLSYQSLLDSAQARATILAFLPWVSCPELEACIQAWAFFEGIHNKAYEYILKNIYHDPTEFTDAILRNTDIMKRADSICRYYDEFIRYSNRVKVFGYTDGLTLYEHKRLCYRAMVSVYALESIRFYVSFACTFAIAQQDVMLGNAKEMKLIARDEALHVGISLNILRLWPKEDDDFARIAIEEQPAAYAIFDECVVGEKEWSHYQLSKGAMLGINETMMGQSIEALANKRMKAIGLEQRYATKQDPFSRWMSNWMSTADEQSAPQETEIDAYKVSAINRDVNDAELLVDF